ncbi:MAG: alpha/beta hydrolase [Bacteroidota bacterium]
MKPLASTLLFLFVLFNHSAYGQEVSDQSVRQIDDLLYVEESSAANDTLQRLNLVLPAEGTDFPLLIWIGGGAWSYVDRHMEMDLGRRMAAAGIAFASVGHRLSSATWKDPALNSGVKHPAHVKDLAAASQWLYEEASEFGYSRDKIFVGGFSSGAHLAALVAMDPTYLNEVGLSPNIIKGIIPISGANDILNYYEVFLNSETRSSLAETHVKAVFGATEDDLVNASPTEYVDNLSTPMLLMADEGPSIQNYTRLFEEKLAAAGYGDFEALYIHNMSHAELWRDLSYSEDSRYRDLIIQFIRSHVHTEQP